MSSIPQVAEDQQIEEVPTSEARQLFNLLYGDALPKNTAVHVRVVSDPERDLGAKRAAVHTRWYRKLDDLPETWPQDANVFFGVALRVEGQTQAALWPALAADLDATSEYTGAEGFPLPTAIVSSGRGLHLYWKLRTPIIDKDEAYRYFRLIQRKIGADNRAAEPERLLRVPSTHNVKYADPPLCTLLELHPERMYDLSDFGAPAESDAPPVRAPVVVPPVDITDAEVQGILDRAFVAKNGQKIRTLWEGRWQELPYPSQSEADQALASALYFWAGGDVGRADAMFRRSSLYRAKWDEAHYTDGSTYGQHTLGGCVGGEVYQDRGGAQVRRVPPITVRSAQQIFENPLPPPEMLVENLFLKKGIGLIAGAPYSYKSTAALDLAVSVASGKPAFDFFSVTTRTPVLYVYAEQVQNLWEQRLREIMIARGVPHNLPIFMVPGYELRLNQPDHLDYLIRLIRERQVGYVILDPLGVFFNLTSEDDAAEVRRVARPPLERLVGETDTTLTALHHSTKEARKFEPLDALDLVRGSGDWQAMTSSILGLWYSHKRGRIKALVRGRIDEPAPFQLGPHDNLPLDAKVMPLKWDEWWTPEEAREDPIRAVLVAIWNGSPDKTTPVLWQQIAAATSYAKATIHRHAKKLIENGYVTPGAKGGWAARASPQVYDQLKGGLVRGLS